SRRRHTTFLRDWSSDVCSSDLGFGTEKIEEELAIFLPEAKIARMDLDTTRAKKAYHQIITSFQEKEIDILVGTQMVTKGLDFEEIGRASCREECSSWTQST